MARLTLEQIKKQLEPYGVEVLSENFSNAHEKLSLRCSCGNVFERTWSNLKRTIREGKNVACFECNKQYLGDYLRKTYEEVKEEIESNGYILLDDKYTNAHEKLHMLCPHGHKYNAEYGSFHSGVRCPCESKTHGIKHDENHIINTLHDDYNFKLIGTYVNAHTAMELKCERCGEINLLSWHQVTTCKVRCMHCRDKVTSYGELKVKDFLSEHGFTYTMQKRFSECIDVKTLPFDFYLDELNIAIEYDGEQHYKKCFGMTNKELCDRKRKDDIKTQFCINNNIYLIRIPYWDFDNIENILEKELLGKRSTTRA